MVSTGGQNNLEDYRFKYSITKIDAVASKTITVNVREDVERRFRKIAASKRGKNKGYLGRALTEAMRRWADEEEGADAVAQTLALLEEGLDLGGLKYSRREELHER
jgi:hypothetical protein